MRDHLLSAQQLTRRYEQLRGDTAPVWSDEAARAIEARWLLPQREHQATALNSLSRQADLVDEVRGQIHRGREQLRVAHERSTQLAGLITEVTQRLDRCVTLARSAARQSEQSIEDASRGEAFRADAEASLRAARAL